MRSDAFYGCIVKSCVFARNHAERRGGAIAMFQLGASAYAHGCGCGLSMQSCRLIGNVAGEGGGMFFNVFNEPSTGSSRGCQKVQILDTKFISNVAQRVGGGSLPYGGK